MRFVPNVPSPAIPNPRSPRRGSRKHVLDWVEQPTFLDELEALTAPAPCRIPAGAHHLPRGHAQPKEARLDNFGRHVLPTSVAWDELRRWWLRYPKGANTPNWDLAVECEIGGRAGLLLVEAKANIRELSKAGKARERETSAGKARSEESRKHSEENSAQINVAIESARVGLEQHLPGIAISRDDHYQLSNRLAFAWKLASCGIPSVVLYLGFTGDKGMRHPLRDEAHWHSVFQAHLAAICPGGLTETPIHVGAAEFWVLCRAKEVLGISPPPVSRGSAPAPPDAANERSSRRGVGVRIEDPAT
jgi:hypothetical protein